MSRTRTSNMSTATSVTRVDVPGNTLSIGTPYGWSGSRSSITEHIFDRYAIRKAAGEVLIGDELMLKEERLVSSQTIVIGPHPSWGTRTVTGDHAGFIVNGNGPHDTYSLLTQSMSGSSLVKAYAKMKDSELLLGEGIATLGQTVSMLRRPFSGALDLLAKIAWKQGKLEKSHSVANAAGKAWLEYRYGWRPLIGDTKVIVREVNRQLGTPFGGRRVARGGVSHSYYYETPATITHPYISGCTVGAATFKGTVRMTSGVIYDLLIDSAGGHMAKVAGARLSDVPATAWELIPYSFVVDWFVGVGDWIRAITPDPTVRVLGSWTTEVCNATNSHRDCKWEWRIDTSPATTYKGSFSPAPHVYVKVKRTANPSLPTWPVRKVSTLSLKNQVDAMALLCGKVTSLFKRRR